MKAYAMISFGGSEAMKMIELPTPNPQDNEVQIHIHYAGVNPIDWKIREGYFKDLFPHDFPMILGKDAAGIVTKIGAKVTKFKIGDKVYSNTNKADKTYGAYAQYITMDESLVAPIPKNISLAKAASIPLVSLTAYQALIEEIDISKINTLLVLGGAGSVGRVAVQLAKIHGINIYATANKAQQISLTALGADVFLDYEDAHYEKNINSSIDAVFDCVGGDALIKSLDIVKDGGTVVTIVGGLNDAAQAKIKDKNINFKFLLTKPNGAQLIAINSLIEAGKLLPSEIYEYPFAQISDAIHAVKQGSAKGKVVVQIQEEA